MIYLRTKTQTASTPKSRFCQYEKRVSHIFLIQTQHFLSWGFPYNDHRLTEVIYDMDDDDEDATAIIVIFFYFLFLVSSNSDGRGGQEQTKL